jgi:cell division protein ZapE
VTALLEAYTEKIASGELRSDAAQAVIVSHLDHLVQMLEAREQRGAIGRFLNRNGAPKGIYIYGDVGRGKTMLMDLFFANLQVKAKRRTHFHAFMQDIHRRRQALRKADVVAQIALDIAKQARVLCLDEMQVSDIADAMIMGRLFQALLAQGTVIVTTSNLPPNQLYKDGLNRDLFVPAIKLMESNFDLMSLASPTDYRLGRVKARESFVTPLGAKADAHVQQIW